MKFRFLLLTLLLFSTGAAAETSDWAMADHIKARLVAEDDKFGVEMQIEDGWHTYYKDPGEAGYETKFDWQNSTDLNVKNVDFPQYKKFDEYGIKTNAYTGNQFFKVDASFGAKSHAEVNVNGAVCKDLCIPYSLNIAQDLPENYGAAGAKTDSYLTIILTAFLAGLVLNIMPCVLPVLSLKVLSVVKQNGAHRLRARLSFLATSAGIIVSFLALAALAISLKSAGMAVGWGLHFQSPYFVGAFMLIILAFAASLFGLFNLNPPSWIGGSGKNDLIGNFFSGMLATLLGTSCTAPVVVTAVGFALAGSNADIIIIFTVMGIGMALPFLLFAARPQLANFLPKPGAWMQKVKYAMGVLLLATAGWLGFILYTQITNPPLEMQSGAKQWVVFDEAKIPGYIADGKTVFVDISAAWCVNCKVNEKAVLDTDEIKEFFAQPNIVLMKGDMTSPSKVLLEYIKKYNRYGIPFNMVHGPNAKDGILLPSLLTKHEVKEAVEKASGK